MKKRWLILCVMVSLLAVNLSVYSASPSHYLRSRLVTLAAKLYQEISSTVHSESRFHYKIGFLPMLDVNGDNEELLKYLEARMGEVISRYPALRVVPAEDVMAVWQDLKEQKLPDEELFRILGERLDLSGVILTSLITHPKHYSINGMVIDTKTGDHNDVELIILERDIIDAIPLGPPQRIEIPTTVIEKPVTDPEPTEPIEPVEPVQESETKPEDEESIEKPQPEVKPVTPEFIDESSDIMPTGEIRYSLALKDQSPRFANLLFGFDLGDFNGDGQYEVGYSAGNTIHIRNLDDYNLLWKLDNYSTMSNDHKLLAVDLDGDKKDELISHGNLLEVENNQIIKGQPRFRSRPVSLYHDYGVALFNEDTIYIVNYQGLVIKRYKLGQGMGKRFVFTSLEGDEAEHLVTTMGGLGDSGTVKVFQAIQSLKENQTLGASYGFAIHALDLNKNGKPEIYLRRNYFDADKFLYSKIYVLETNQDGLLELIGESSELDYFIVDFATDRKNDSNRLVVGGMYLTDKRQSIQDIQSQLFYYNLEELR